VSPWIYTLSLHDALPIFGGDRHVGAGRLERLGERVEIAGSVIDQRDLHDGSPSASSASNASSAARNRSISGHGPTVTRSASPSSDRKSTRLNSSHVKISY